MFSRSSTPPAGPRSSSSTRRGMNRGNRGGIQKRAASSARIDRDGDLVMDPGEGNETTVRGRAERSGGHIRGPSGRGEYNSDASYGNHSARQSQQANLRGLGSQYNHTLDSRISHGVSGEHGNGRNAAAQMRDPVANVSFRIRGLKESKAAANPDGGLKDLLSFLERKASGSDAEPHRVRIMKSYLEGGDAIVIVRSEDSAKILRLNNYKFAGALLLIEIYQAVAPDTPMIVDNQGISQNAKETESRIKSILSTRYDVNFKLLNLSALGRDAGLIQMGMFDAKNRISKLFPVLMVICDRLFSSPEEKREAIISVSLADNDLNSISSVTSLAQTFPDLQNLDLSRNKLSDLRAIEGWRWKFRKLQNLEISGNPLEVNVPGYAQEILKWYPTLQILNGVQVRELRGTVTEAAKSEARLTERLAPIPTSGPDFRDVNSVGESFIRQFLPLYDTDRSSLVSQFYDTQSVFSVSINVSAPRSDSGQLSQPFASDQFKQSRNLVKAKGLQATIRLFRGVEAIRSIWLQFPPTSHAKLETSPTKYLIECHPLPGLADPSGQSFRGVDGLILTIHGEYEEKDSRGSAAVVRSFSRTFVLGPGYPGGSSVRVISDTLMLRAWGPLLLPPLNQDKTTAIMQPGEELMQENLIRQLSSQTNMTAEYSKMCLAESGWNLEQALIAFNANKTKLPPNAFMYQGTAI